MLTLIHRLQDAYDNRLPDSYWNDNDDEPAPPAVCWNCGCCEESFTDDCYTGICWRCPDCGKEQYE